MTMDEFAQELRELILERMPDIEDIQIKRELKNNSVAKLGMLFEDKRSNVSPTIYLEEFYEAYQGGIDISEIADVGNVVIITESQISFLQMLGRVRAESTECLNLYFLERSAEIFAKRERRLSQVMEIYEEVEKTNFDAKRLEYMHVIWDGSNKAMADMYRKIFVLGRYEYNLPFEHTGRAYVEYGKECLRINYFAKEKLGANYLSEARFHMFSMISPIKVAEEQMKWIGKNPEELSVISSSYRESQMSALREELLEISDFTVSELMKKKELLAKKYRKDFFADVVSKAGSFSKEKLRQILERSDLSLVESNGEDGTKRYSVVERGDVVC